MLGDISAVWPAEQGPLKAREDLLAVASLEVAVLPTAFSLIPVRRIVSPRVWAAGVAEQQRAAVRPGAISLRPLPVDGVVLIRRTVSDVAIAAVATLIAFVLLEVATPAGASSATYATSSAAIAIAALWAGVRAGLIATALTAAVTAHLYLEPGGALAVADPGDLIGLALFAMNGLILTSLCGWQRSRPSRERGSCDAPPVSTVAASTSTSPPRRITRLPGADRGPVITVLNGHLIERLTARELDVLQLLGSGLSNTEIADGLFVSMNTVKSHLKSIFGKLGVVSRTQAVVRAGELGLLAPDHRRPTNHAA